MTKKHFGTVSQGKFKPADPVAFKLDFCRHEGKQVYVTIDKQTKKRSNNQNSYYWGVVIELLREAAGYTPNEMHDALRMEFLRTNKGNCQLPTIRSTTELTTGEMENYLEACRQLGAKTYGLYIPTPSEVVYE